MLGLFVQEANEHLETLENDLVALEASPQNADLLNRLFRAIHSVKGTAGFFGLTPITDLAHVMESVMALLRDGRMAANCDLINLFLTGTDKLKAMVATPDQAASTDTSAERTALHALLHSEPPATPAAPDKPILSLYLSGFRIDPELVRNGLHHGQNIYVVQLNLNTDIEALGTLIDTATEMGGLDGGGGLGEEIVAEVICSLLFSTAMEPDLLLCAFNLPENQLTAVPSDILKEWLKTQPTLAPSKSAPVPAAKPAHAPAQVHAHPAQGITSAPAAADPTWHGRPAHGIDSAPDSGRPAPITQAPSASALPATVAPTSVVPAAAPAPTSTSITPTPLAPAVPAAPGTKPKTEDTVRISVSLLDGLMNLAGEMVLGRNQLLRIAAPSRENASAASAAAMEGLTSIVQGISGVTTDLQRTIHARPPPARRRTVWEI